MSESTLDNHANFLRENKLANNPFIELRSCLKNMRQEECEDLLLNQIKTCIFEIPGSIVYKSKLKRKSKK